MKIILTDGQPEVVTTVTICGLDDLGLGSISDRVGNVSLL
jgi:hypothetical protein